MKKINIIYWISTALLLLVMGGGAIPGLLKDPKSVEMITKVLKYPAYFITFIGVAKILGTIAILIPGLPKLKEWVYAGFAFDLIGATWSMAAVKTPAASIAPMAIFIILLVVSYIYHRKRLQAKGQLKTV